MKAKLMDRIKAQLVRHEGLRLKPHRCTAGKLTIGIGRNLDDRYCISNFKFQYTPNQKIGVTTGMGISTYEITDISPI